jgi:hypothetical protein
MDQSKAPTLADIELTLLKLINVTRLVRMIGPDDEELQRYIAVASSRVDTTCFLKIARALATFRALLEDAVEADRVERVRFQRGGAVK